MLLIVALHARGMELGAWRKGLLIFNPMPFSLPVSDR
jgi:hypothetical protein